MAGKGSMDYKMSFPTSRQSLVELLVMTHTGKRIVIKADLFKQTVEEVKELLEECEGTPTSQMRLLFDNKKLEDPVVIHEYGITDRSTLHQVLRVRGGFHKVFQEDIPLSRPPPQSHLLHVVNMLLGVDRRRVMNLNIEGRLFLHDVAISDEGQNRLRLALSKNQTLKHMRFRIPNQLTDGTIQMLCQLFEQNHTLKRLDVSGDQISNELLGMLLTSLSSNRNLLSVTINDDLDLSKESFLTLINFIEKRLTLTKMSCIRRSIPCLKTEQRDRIGSRYYHKISVKGNPKLMLRSECLQYRLMDWCLKHDVPSAIEINSNKLILFITREEEKTLMNSLAETLQAVEPLLRSSYQVHRLDRKLEIVLENNDKIHPGSSLEFVCSNNEVNTATLGAILRDDAGKLYMLSTNHGQAFSECKFSGKHVGRCVAEVFQYSPFIDGCLIEVENEEVRVMCEALLPSPMVQTSLCGPYTGPDDNIAAPYSYVHDNQIDRPENLCVAKCTESLPYTCGRLVYYNFTYPMRCNNFLTNALLVFPEADAHTFTAAGDSGAVIFRKDQCQGAHCPTRSCHESLAMHYASLKNMQRDVRPAIVHRLDTIIEYFSATTRRQLHLFKGEHVCAGISSILPLFFPPVRGRDLDGNREHCKTQ